LDAQLRHIKRNISQSNSSTIIKVMGKERTVAEALAERDEIPNKKDWLRVLKRQYADAIREVSNKNETQRKNLLNGGMSPAEVDVLMSTPRVTLLDPLEIQSKIDALEDWLANFESDLRDSLVESNNRTTIPWPLAFEKD
jgi:hypothetical protein